MDFAAEVTTRQSMRKLVNRHHDENHRPNHDQAAETQERWSRSGKPGPIQIADCQTGQNRKYCKYLKCGSESPSRSGQQPGENPFRIERSDLLVQQIAVG